MVLKTVNSGQETMQNPEVAMKQRLQRNLFYDLLGCFAYIVTGHDPGMASLTALWGLLNQLAGNIWDTDMFTGQPDVVNF